MQTKQRYPLLVLLCSLLLAGCNKEAENQQRTDVQADPAAQASYPAQLFWGDTHLHTSNSVDAFGFGNRLGAEAALRFARGEAVTSTRGVQAKLTRPLDFLVISDHSDAIGATRALYEAPRMLLPGKQLKRWWDMMHESEEGSLQVTAEIIDLGASGEAPSAEEAALFEDDKRISKLWRSHNKIVDDYNQPGQFTAFVGFEYTPMPNGNNLHRVVMFRDGSEKTNTVTPIPSLTNPDPEQLWAWMAQYEANTGGQVLAMPHNSNVSNGLMFAMTRLDGSPIDKAYAEIRAKYEPVVEITQIKGDSETHPFLSPNDEFADYGNTGWDTCNLSCTEQTSEDDYAGSYTREALKRGLQLQAQTGVNPYAFGVIGSTDSHTSLATADENNFFGKHTGNEINVEGRALAPQNLGTREGRFGWHYLSSGYAAVWATSNTREAIFDAFMRREVYATTGPRIQVRMFAGYDFSDADLGDKLVAEGYARGVPMGGELPESDGKAPSFLLSALMDPESASLDRIQIVKGWIDAEGGTHEKVYNLGWSDEKNRKIDALGKLPAVANTVDLGTGTWDNNGGAPALEAAWTDPDFDPAQSAFYYARVLEIPTPTWASLDAIKYGLELPDDVLRVHQERAYTSPIWYYAR
ncbi:DUF3604 domain-containing protein [Halioglobus maricola]|uniref:DUF3604 domain-containing protein n=1 Tax=Halioglobus maricola TaxID=2601894 RepID=A0A5P9NHT1_9GAMM|nr:DUF3604 domain-containing protein [Halioglobus maricola]QFU75387.1 DUF3604 domain-containing protein [Halioglobus maricola]